MKYIVLFVATLAVAINAQFTPGGVSKDFVNQVKASVTECVIKTGMNIADINKILGNTVPTGNEACFLACILKKLNVMDSSNRIQMGVAENILEPVKNKDINKYNTIIQVLQTCTNQQGTPDPNECTAASNYKKCLVDNGHP